MVLYGNTSYHIYTQGVIIHVHDIFLPYDYPQWVCDRFFSEQYVLAACLLNTDNYKIISPDYYLLAEKKSEDVGGAFGKSLRYIR